MRIIGNPNQLPSGATMPAGPLTHPRECAVLGRTEDPEGFIQTDKFIPAMRNYETEILISVAAVKEMGRMVGMASREDMEALQAQIKDELDARDAELAELREAVSEAQELEKARLLVAKADKKE